MPSFFVRALKLHRFEPNRIVTSYLVSPRTLVIIRGLEFLYVLVASIDVWVTSIDALDYFKYFTHLSYFGLLAYLFASVVWGVLYCRQPESERIRWVNSRSPWWGYTHWLLYSTVVVYSVIVPIVFWTLLASGMSSWTPIQYYQNISEHALDGVFGALVELILNRHFLQPIHSVFVAVVMIFYMFWTFIVHAILGTWVYPFLDWGQGPIAAAYYIGIAIGVFVIYFILLFLHKLRNKSLARYSQVDGDMDLEHSDYRNRRNEKEEADEGSRLENV